MIGATQTRPASPAGPQEAPVSQGGPAPVAGLPEEPPARFGRGAYALLYLFGLLVYALVAWPHTHPPYMDSFYYVDIARNLAHGQGLTERFVWNYLAGMPSLPHPSGEYWLPGVSLLLAPAWGLGGYRACTLLVAAIAALAPLLAARVGFDLFRSRRHALSAAGLTLFNGIWFHDWTTPDAFVPYAVLATLTLILAYKGLQGHTRAYALAGLTAGLAALTRQEGVMLLVAVLAAALLTPRARRRLWPGGIVGMVALYGLAQAPWLLHNLAVLRTLSAPGGLRTLWMRSYDLFYSLHTELLTPQAYLAWGLPHLISVRVAAVAFTLAMWAALWWGVLVVPLVIGLWRLRRRIECRPFLTYWALLALALPLVFTVTLQNGTVGHASAALVPFGAVLVTAGFDAIGVALARLRGRNGARLARDMSIIALGLAVAVSLGMAWRTFPAHGDEYTHDVRVVAWLHRHNPIGTPVMVLDPPAFAYLDDGRYVVAPSDGLAAARAVAQHYGVRYWALDPLHAAAQEMLYEGRIHPSWLRRVAVIDGVQMYMISLQQSAISRQLSARS